MPLSKADLILKSILHAAPAYKPCLTCQWSYFTPTGETGWCSNVEPGSSPRPVDEVNTCPAWKLRIEK